MTRKPVVRGASILLAAGGLIATSAPVASASGPHLSPPNTLVKAHLKRSQMVKVEASVAGVAVTVSCTTLTASGITPVDGLAAPLSAPPLFTGCTDSTGGTDTIKTSGTWRLAADPTGNSLTLHVPKGGVVVTSSHLKGCRVIVGPANITGGYDNVNTWTIDASSVEVKGAGCTTSSTGTVSATIVLSPGVSVVG